MKQEGFQWAKRNLIRLAHKQVGALSDGAQLGESRKSLWALLESEVSLLNEIELDASWGKERNDGLLAFSDDEHVGWTGSEWVAIGVLDVGNIEAAGVLLDVLEDTDSADVVTADDEDLSTVLVLNESVDFTSLKVEL